VRGYLSRQPADFQPVYSRSTALYLLYGNSRIAPTSDARITKALKLLVNHDEMVEMSKTETGGSGYYSFPFASACVAAGWGLQDKEYTKFLEYKQPKTDANKQANDLLRAAGFSASNPLRFDFTGRDSASVRAKQELLQAQWKQATSGVIDASIKLVDNATMNRIRAQGEFVVNHGGESPGHEPNKGLETQFRTGGSRNFPGFSDQQVDAWIDKQVTLTDVAERKALVKQIIEKLIDIYPGTSLDTGDGIVAVAPRVHGLFAGSGLGYQFDTVWLDG
jgi:ABC-type transport system substrate-binding protein